jgi:hypothetical protein
MVGNKGVTVSHPEVEEAEKSWKSADVSARQARAKNRGTPNRENAQALHDSEDRWEEALDAWEHKINHHGSPADRLSLLTASKMRLRKPLP